MSPATCEPQRNKDIVQLWSLSISAPIWSDGKSAPSIYCLYIVSLFWKEEIDMNTGRRGRKRTNFSVSACSPGILLSKVVKYRNILQLWAIGHGPHHLGNWSDLPWTVLIISWLPAQLYRITPAMSHWRWPLASTELERLKGSQTSCMNKELYCSWTQILMAFPHKTLSLIPGLNANREISQDLWKLPKTCHSEAKQF